MQQPPGSNHLTDTDRSLLSGLADFSATVTEKTVNGNPARPGELDSFSYDFSQATQSKGLNRLNRTLVQNQQSHLTAQYHKPLYAGQKLELTTDSESQNYRYYQINDQACSTSRIGYVEGELVEASVSHSASQSTRISKYVKGHLEEDNVIPASASKTQNFLVVLQQALEQDKAATLGRGHVIARIHLGRYSGQSDVDQRPARAQGLTVHGVSGVRISSRKSMNTLMRLEPR
ncbi:hypothetical protein [Pseudomonas sp. 31-12]|uniref:hypothetical protein n=1 Tax=Pseudomonas sp. 31-12 TaxID=2201356 RepID=UPI0013A56C40|nr:hypothetical protein [Pseudomonas sp. 31-12]